MANPTVHIPEPLLEDIDKIVDERSEYRNRSHFIQRAAEKEVARVKKAIAQGEPLDFA